MQHDLLRTRTKNCFGLYTPEGGTCCGGGAPSACRMLASLRSRTSCPSTQGDAQSFAPCADIPGNILKKRLENCLEELAIIFAVALGRFRTHTMHLVPFHSRRRNLGYTFATLRLRWEKLLDLVDGIGCTGFIIPAAYSALLPTAAALRKSDRSAVVRGPSSFAVPASHSPLRGPSTYIL